MTTKLPVRVSPDLRTLLLAEPVTFPVRFPVTFPVKFAVMTPAENPPEASRLTRLLGMLAEVALPTLDAVAAIVAALTPPTLTTEVVPTLLVAPSPAGAAETTSPVRLL